MEQMDGTICALVALGTTFIVGALKRFLPKFRSNKNLVAGVAFILPPVLVIAAKVAGEFPESGWKEVLLWALGGGVGTGLINDKVVNPFKALIVGFLAKTKKSPPAEESKPEATAAEGKLEGTTESPSVSTEPPKEEEKK